MTNSRRSLLKGAAMAAAGAGVLASARVEAQAAPKTPFEVAGTYIPIVGSAELFPVRRVYCIGRNYAAHAREMGSDPTREPPFFFQKPTDAIQYVPIGAVDENPYPSLTKNYHYEVELVCALKSGGVNIPQDKALDHVFGYAVGLDMTRRDCNAAWAIRKSPGRSARASTAPRRSGRSIRSPPSVISPRARSRWR
jgi:fumarylpyruvate hydrolase